MDLHPSALAKIEAIYQDIHRYPERKYYISDLARQSNLTSQNFNAAFKQRYGITIPQSITNARVQRAKELLLAGHSIKQVTAALGYKQVINFHKTFKRYTGLTPRQYYLLHRNK